MQKLRLAFELDLPYIENEKNIESIINKDGCVRSEATKLDYQMNWKEKRKEFSLQTRCITSFYERLIGDINIRSCKKILVECVPEITEKSVKNLLGVNVVQVQCDYDIFLQLNDYDKKKMSLELLMAGIKQVVFKHNCDIEPFEQTYREIIEADYKNEWMWQKSSKSPDKKSTAGILLQHELNEIEIFIVIHDSSGVETFRKSIISELPDEYAYAGHLGEIKWVSDKEIALINKKRDREWLVNNRPAEEN